MENICVLEPKLDQLSTKHIMVESFAKKGRICVKAIVVQQL